MDKGCGCPGKASPLLLGNSKPNISHRIRGRVVVSGIFEPVTSFQVGGRIDSIEPYLESLKQLHPGPPRDLRIRLLNDPFPPDEWYASMILDIYFDRVDIQTLRDKVPGQRDAMVNMRFDVIYDWRDRQLIPVEGHNLDSPVGAGQSR